MPTYHIEMFEGRTPEQKKKLVAEVTRVTVEVLGGSAESVDIIIHEVKRDNWATGGKLWSEPRSWPGRAPGASNAASSASTNIAATSKPVWSKIS